MAKTALGELTVKLLTWSAYDNHGKDKPSGDGGGGKSKKDDEKQRVDEDKEQANMLNGWGDGLPDPEDNGW